MQIQIVLNFNRDIAIFNLERINNDFCSSIVRRFSSLRIKCPAVPGTDDFTALDHSLPQWATAVEADVVHGSDGAVGICNADCFFTAEEFFSFVVAGEFGLRGEFGEGHGSKKRRGKPRLHMVHLLWLKCLRDHHLTFEALHHVGI